MEVDRKGGRVSVAILLLIIGIAALFTDLRSNYLDGLRSSLSVSLSSLVMAVDNAKGLTQKLGLSISTASEQYEKNQQLIAENLLLRSQIQRLSAQELENKRLRALLQIDSELEHRAMVAEISSVSREPFTHKVVISKGFKDNVYVGQAVIDGAGFFGQVEKVNENNSSVIMITDSNHAVPVQVKRTGLRTLVYGSGLTSKILVPYIGNGSDVAVGDQLITSGLGERFPPGYNVGVIESVKGDSDSPFLSIKARPSASLDSGKALLLVWPEKSD